MEHEIGSLQARLGESENSFLQEKGQLEERLRQATDDVKLISSLQSEKESLTQENQRLFAKVSELQGQLDALTVESAKIPLLEEEKVRI